MNYKKLVSKPLGQREDGRYLLIVINELPRNPEVAVVNSTNPKENIEEFGNIFPRHGYWKLLKIDNRPDLMANNTTSSSKNSDKLA